MSSGFSPPPRPLLGRFTQSAACSAIVAHASSKAGEARVTHDAMVSPGEHAQNRELGLLFLRKASLIRRCIRLIMAYIASNIATVPSTGFQWYLIFLEGPFADEIKKEIDAHFLTLAKEVGKEVLVVRGFDPTPFRESVMEAPAFFNEKWGNRAAFPCLIVTNRIPTEAVSDADVLEKGKVMIFPLADIYREHKSIAPFLSDLLTALKVEDAVKALDNLDGSTLEKGWGWLSRYFKMDPGFFGFNLKLDSAMRDLLARSRS
jgi:hypothetical protein